MGQAVDAMECGMHHGDSLPDGATDAQVVEVRDLLALDYAKSFQVPFFIMKLVLSKHVTMKSETPLGAKDGWLLLLWIANKRFLDS